MCGIWGFTSANGVVPLEAAWDGLCSLRDRGPDDWGLYADGSGKLTDKSALDGTASVVLGNRRLSIIDLSPAGNQPMTVDGRYWLVYNGELYNYRELRTELRDRGHEFASSSDTEVLLRGFMEWGDDCVERFRGMFAFAIWDEQTEELFAARDRLGIKPFYYSEAADRLVFASEVTSLLDAGVVDKKLDPIGVEGFLAFGSVPSPRTIIDGVRSLSPGAAMRYDVETGAVEIKRYWEPDFSQDGTLSAEKVREHLAKSVELRLRSDVPVGAFLSGGLDSSSVVAAMQAAGDTDLRSFAITFEEEEYAEGDDAAAVAEELGTDHQTHLVTTEDVRSEMEAFIAAMDQPTIDGINTYFVSRIASEAGLRVALSGVGGDEIFRGYTTFKMIPRARQLAGMAETLPTPAESMLTAPLARLNPHTGAPAEEAATLLRSDDQFGAAYLAVRGLFTKRERTNLLNESNTDFASELELSVMQTLREGSIGDAVTHAELTWYMHNQLLRDTDVMSMEHSLEVRVPMLDTELVSVVTGAADDDFEGEGEKALLQAAMRDELPERVLRKDKRGFTFPFAKWLSDDLVDVVDDALTSERLVTTPLDPAAVADVRDRFERGRIHWSRIWALVVLSLWIDEHIVDEESDT